MTDKSIEREIEFTDWWYFHNKKSPTYADAIEWADRTMIDKACELLKRYNSGVRGKELIEAFRKAMEEEI